MACNFQGLITNEEEFPTEEKRIMWNFQDLGFGLGISKESSTIL